ncbi:MAG: Na+/H+ antiporter NhaC family protein [Synergistaceae bacterium]|nr:Na+/H+ antiporter NhaC family protein [Synergistaceae bacterium]
MLELLKLSPVVVLGVLMNSAIGPGLDILIATPLAMLYAVAVGMFFAHVKFSDLLDAAVEGMRRVVLVFLILQMAYAVATCFMATGVAAEIITVAISLGVTAKLIAVTALLVTAVLSVATGTSWGTFAACAPIFLWLNHIVGGSVILTVSAIAGGSCFGDNIGLISDTTVVSSTLQNVAITDRVKHQGVWSLLCLGLGAVAFYVAAVSMNLPDTVGNAGEVIAQIPGSVWEALAEKRPAAVTLLRQVQAGGLSWYMVLPLVAVLVLAGMGVHTLICLSAGIFGSLFCGLCAGTVADVMQFVAMVQASFSDAGNWVIVMVLWIVAFGGVMSRMDAFGAVAGLVVRFARNVRQLIFANGLLCLIGNFALANDFAEIATISPIIKDLTERNVKGSPAAMYRLALRNATLADAMAVYGSQLIPWHVFMAFFMGIVYAVYPAAEGTVTILDVITHNYLSWIAVVSMLLLTVTGWDRFIPLFGIPREPEVELVRD